MNTQEQAISTKQRELLTLTMHSLSPERAFNDLGQKANVPEEFLSEDGSIALWKLEEGLVKVSKRNPDENMPFLLQPFELYQICLYSLRKSSEQVLTPYEAERAHSLAHACHIVAVNFFEAFTFSDEYTAIARLLNPNEIAIIRKDLASLLGGSTRFNRAKCRVFRLLDDAGIFTDLLKANEAFNFLDLEIELEEDRLALFDNPNSKDDQDPTAEL